MSCLDVSLTRVGGGSADVSRIGGVSVSATRIGGAQVAMERIGGVDIGATRIGGISCHFLPICASSVGAPYLEISPTLVWMWADPVENDVFSNTNWNVN